MPFERLHATLNVYSPKGASEGTTKSNCLIGLPLNIPSGYLMSK